MRALLSIFYLVSCLSLGAYEKLQPETAYYSEGAASADINNDGVLDLVYGSTWYAGPDFKQSQVIFPQKAFSKTSGYANSFFSFPYDFNRDGWVDVLAWGLPNSPGIVYVNPQGAKGPWEKQVVFPAVGHESPVFTDIDGDGQPDLVCVYQGGFGYATFNPDDPFAKWTWHAINRGPINMHGLGVGDVNGDGRMDLLTALGWFEQGARSDTWSYHKAAFGRGGAQMFAYDVDGDGDNDVISSLAGHGWGLSWFEQNAGAFVEHRIMGSKPGDNPFAVAFSQLHAMELADMDGDGLKDLITGKCYFAHNGGDPGAKDPAVMVVFHLRRENGQVVFEPEEIDADSGLGRQISVLDVNRDGRLDVVSGNKKGAFVFLQTGEGVRMPKVGPPVRVARMLKAGGLHWEGEDLEPARPPAGTIRPQPMQNWTADTWSGDNQLWWTDGKPGNSVEFSLEVAKAGRYAFNAVFTKANDYAIAQLSLNGKPLGEPMDFYDTQVVTTGVLSLGTHDLSANSNVFTVLLTGANPKAAKKYMFGIDYLELVPEKSSR